MDPRELWQAALGEIELSISRANFITWFRSTDINLFKDGVVFISTPNGFTKEWLENKYNKLILKALRNISPEIRDVQFIIGAKAQFKPLPVRRKKETPKAIAKDQLRFEESTVDKETNLNNRYSFDNFVVGSFNELAQAAGRAISKSLGTLYNPLFIYGGVGLGKTHLLQAIGNEIIKKNASKKVKYLSSEKYTTELVDAISKKGMESFKEKYRKIDALIIDDIQFIGGKEKTQEEFFHTFNTLHQQNKQIVLSSDRPPKAISTLTERLRSRFEGGMIADITPPDFETRLAIIKAKAQEKSFNVADDILEQIANYIQTNIRELEGALNRVIATCEMTNSVPTLDTTNKILARIVPVSKKITNFKNIIKAVAEFYDINANELLNRSRKKEIVHPRQVAMYLIREELNSSYPFIGEKLGGRDHTTAMYAYDKINKRVENSNSFKQEISLIKERIYS